MPQYTSPDLPSNVFIDHLNETGKKSAAILYGSFLFKFQAWLNKNKRLKLDDTTPVLVEQFLATLNSDSSVNGALAAIRGYFKYKSQSLPMGHPSVIIEMQRLNQISMIKPKRKPRIMKKVSLTPVELKKFLKVFRDSEVSEELYAGVVVLFYFGARSGEMAGLIAEAEIDLKKRSMKIQTEKTHAERYLSWGPEMDRYMKTWYSLASKGLKYPGAWITKRMKQELRSSKILFFDTEITSRTARRTFETQMRIAGVQDIIIRAVLGHTQSGISDVYTDWTQFVPEIDKAMRENHYMITSGVI